MFSSLFVVYGEIGGPYPRRPEFEEKCHWQPHLEHRTWPMSVSNLGGGSWMWLSKVPNEKSHDHGRVVDPATQAPQQNETRKGVLKMCR